MLRLDSECCNTFHHTPPKLSIQKSSSEQYRIPNDDKDFASYFDLRRNEYLYSRLSNYDKVNSESNDNTAKNNTRHMCSRFHESYNPSKFAKDTSLYNKIPVYNSTPYRKHPDSLVSCLGMHGNSKLSQPTRVRVKYTPIRVNSVGYQPCACSAEFREIDKKEAKHQQYENCRSPHSCSCSPLRCQMACCDKNEIRNEHRSSKSKPVDKNKIQRNKCTSNVLFDCNPGGNSAFSPVGQQCERNMLFTNSEFTQESMKCLYDKKRVQLLAGKLKCGDKDWQNGKESRVSCKNIYKGIKGSSNFKYCDRKNGYMEHAVRNDVDCNNSKVVDESNCVQSNGQGIDINMNGERRGMRKCVSDRHGNMYVTNWSEYAINERREILGINKGETIGNSDYHGNRSVRKDEERFSYGSSVSGEKNKGWNGHIDPLKYPIGMNDTSNSVIEIYNEISREEVRAETGGILDATIDNTTYKQSSEKQFFSNQLEKIPFDLLSHRFKSPLNNDSNFLTQINVMGGTLSTSPNVNEIYSNNSKTSVDMFQDTLISGNDGNASVVISSQINQSHGDELSMSSKHPPSILNKESVSFIHEKSTAQSNEDLPIKVSHLETSSFNSRRNKYGNEGHKNIMEKCCDTNDVVSDSKMSCHAQHAAGLLGLTRVANEHLGQALAKEKRRSKNNNCLHLWQFLRRMLDEEQTKVGRCIEWTNRENGEFRLIKTAVIADLWGKSKNRNCMTYEKMARAMRYYYKMNILKKVPHKRLHFRFGEKVMNKAIFSPNPKPFIDKTHSYQDLSRCFNLNYFPPDTHVSFCQMQSLRNIKSTTYHPDISSHNMTPCHNEYTKENLRYPHDSTNRMDNAPHTHIAATKAIGLGKLESDNYGKLLKEEVISASDNSPGSRGTTISPYFGSDTPESWCDTDEELVVDSS